MAKETLEKADYPPVRKPPAPPAAEVATTRLVGKTFDEKLSEIKTLCQYYEERFGPEWRMVWRDTVKINL
jgi:hypothetical protein